MRGRPPKPTALKALQGDTSHRPDDGRTEVQMPTGTPEPPAHMVETTYDHTGRTDGQNAVTIIEEIQRRLSNSD